MERVTQIHCHGDDTAVDVDKSVQVEENLLERW